MIKKISINLEDMVYNYPTNNKEGFTQVEIENLLTWFPTINREKFDYAMMGNTGLLEEGQFITYHIDVYNALMCGLEERNLKVGEWD